jgi:large subunit ribosomal protein L4
MATTKTSAGKKTTVTKAAPAAKATAAKKPAAKAPVQAAAPKTEAKETLAKGLSLTMVDMKGEEAGKMTVPHGIFDADINRQLIALAVRVYLANQREGSASTKTRGEVEGSTRKIYKQKGTGRARHGSIRAPIFVGGGIVFGPRPHSFSRTMPGAMRRKALVSALSEAFAGKRVTVIDDWSALKAKTREAAAMLEAVGITGKVLLVVPAMTDKVVKISRNIEGVTIMPSDQVTTYDVVTHKSVVCSQAAVETLATRLTKEI